MTDIELYFNKSVGENASLYYDKSKKMRKKIEGARAALERSKEMLEKAEKEKTSKEGVKETKKVERKTEWYEKFRWFISSEGFLCIGGRDATTNEIVVKKHAEKDDIIFHTEMAGSPFFIIKTGGKKPGRPTLDESAQATASYSRAWKLGITLAEVFYVNPEQVSKEAEAGEFIARGAFMIRGKKNFIRIGLELAIGIKDGQIIGGPVDSIKKNAEKYVVIAPGKEKASDAAKKIKQKIGGEIDDIIRFLPSGGVKLER